ncbi:hypothetical protein [Labilithrix luteola]|uniref:hypothetical protein n=1 Tax=Labilithrix luteola TaxID=1391654 RepID=UPI001F0AD5F3
MAKHFKRRSGAEIADGDDEEGGASPVGCVAGLPAAEGTPVVGAGSRLSTTVDDELPPHAEIIDAASTNEANEANDANDANGLADLVMAIVVRQIRLRSTDDVRDRSRCCEELTPIDARRGSLTP